MFCPQCGTESSSGQQYCRSCGANLKFIGKAVTLSEAVARSDRGPLPKIKEMMQSMKGEQTTEEVSRAMDQMNNELVRSFPADGVTPSGRLDRKAKEDPPELRRENHIVKGMVGLFAGVAIMIFLYYFSLALVLKIPPEALAKIPFEVEPVARMLWLIGLIPTMSGLGRIIAGVLVRPAREEAVAIKGGAQPEQLFTPAGAEPESLPGSVTEGTTELLDYKASMPGSPIPINRRKR
jgi:zinc-ribbon domain